jgi:hypothetical protein
VQCRAASPRSWSETSTDLPFRARSSKRGQRPDLVAGVEACGRLIGEDQGCVLRQRARDQDARLFAARKLCRGRCAEGGQVHGLKRISTAPCPLRRALAARQVRYTAQHDERFHSDGPGDFPRLRQPGHLPRAICGGFLHQRVLPHRRKKPQRRAHQRRLARTVRSDQADDLARADRQVASSTTGIPL